MATATIDDRLVNQLSSSLAEHLLRDHALVNDGTERPALSQDLIDQVMPEIRRRRSSPLLPTDPTDAEIFQRARDSAVHLWSEQSTRVHDDQILGETKPTAVTLFLNQFHSSGGGLLDSVVTWDKIQGQATTPREKLVMLNKVEYIDDIMMDWEDIRSFLQAELIHSTVDVVALHRQWWHLTRGSSNPEYRALQADLVQNLVSVVDRWALHEGAGFENTGLELELCVCTSLDMFGDWVDGTGFFDPNAHQTAAIGEALWDWLGHQSLQRVMRRHCPHGKWLAQWVAYQMPNRTIALVSRSCRFGKADCSIPTFLFQQASLLLERAPLSAAVVPRDDDDDFATLVFAVSMFRSVLSSTRVSRFPWHLLLPKGDDLSTPPPTPPTPPSTDTSARSRHILIDLCVLLIRVTLLPTVIGGVVVAVVDDNNDKNDYATIMCSADLIETILIGTQQRVAAAESRLATCKAIETELLPLAPSRGVAHQILRSMLDRMSRCYAVPTP